MRASFAVVWLSFLSGCGSSEGEDLFSDDGTGGTGTSGAGGSSAGGAGANGGTGANGSQSGGATASGGSDAGSVEGGASGTGGVTGAGGTAGTGGVIGAGGAPADGGPPTSGDAGCAFTACACPAACQCDVNGGHSYAFCATLETWASASAACASAGARLVRVDDASENEWLLARASGEAMWLGASDAEMEGAWRWEDGEQFWDDTVSLGAGAPVGGLYSNWHGPTPPFAAAEPNNTGGGLLGMGEDCGMIRVSDGTWNDGSCSTTASYVCEVY